MAKKQISVMPYKKLIEQNPLALATASKAGRPNVIGVAFVKVVSGKALLVSDNFMSQTRRNLAANNSVCLAVWDKQWKGCKLVGKAEYHSEGKWARMVKAMPENKGLPAKGAILVKIAKVIPLQ